MHWSIFSQNHGFEVSLVHEILLLIRKLWFISVWGMFIQHIIIIYIHCCGGFCTVPTWTSKDMINVTRLGVFICLTSHITFQGQIMTNQHPGSYILVLTFSMFLGCPTGYFNFWPACAGSSIHTDLRSWSEEELCLRQGVRNMIIAKWFLLYISTLGPQQKTLRVYPLQCDRKYQILHAWWWWVEGWEPLSFVVCKYYKCTVAVTSGFQTRHVQHAPILQLVEG